MAVRDKVEKQGQEVSPTKQQDLTPHPHIDPKKTRRKIVLNLLQHTNVVTQNCSPAPSQSDAVIIGLETQTNPFS